MSNGSASALCRLWRLCLLLLTHDGMRVVGCYIATACTHVSRGEGRGVQMVGIAHLPNEPVKALAPARKARARTNDLANICEGEQR